MFSAYSTEEDPIFHTFRIQPDEALDQTAAADLSRFKFAPPGHELFIASSADVSATTSPEFSPVFAAQQQQLLQQQLQQPHVSPTAAAQRGVDSLAIRLPAPEPTKVSPNAVIDLKAGVPLIPIASSSAMTLEDMLVAQREAGIVEVAAYSDIVAWYSLRNPEGLKTLRAAEDHSRASHRGSNNNNNSSNEDQMFLGQLPMFMTSDCLAMTLDFVLDYPGAVRRVMLRADHASGHAPYALVQVRNEVRDVFLSLDRRVYFGRTHAFFTRTTTNAPVFQRIVARVLGVDAERPSANRDYQYARSAMVASHAKHSNQGASKGASSSRGALPPPPASFPTRGHVAPQPLPPPPPPQYQMPPVAWQPAQPQLQPQHQPQQQQGVMMVPYHPSSFVTPQHHIAYAPPPPPQQQQQPMAQQHHTVVYAAPNQQQQQAWTYAQPQPGSAVYSQPGHAAVVMPPHQFFAPLATPHPSMMQPAQAHYF